MRRKIPLLADLVLTGGHVLTMAAHSGVAEAVAVSGGRLLAVGTRQDVAALTGPGTEVVDLRGATVLPGFIDSHVHQLEVGRAQMRPSGRAARSVADIQRVVAEAAMQRPAGEWILCANDWRDVQLAERRMPDRWELDAAAPHHPVYLPMGGHVVALNSPALQAAGITAATPDPEGGIVERLAGSREPTGVLCEPGALCLIHQALPPETSAELGMAIRAACRVHHAMGITSVVDPSVTIAEMQGYCDSYRRGELTVRTSLLVWVDTEADVQRLHGALPAELQETGQGDRWLRFGGVKAFLDGGLMLGTALLSEPYAVGRFGTGVQVTPTDVLSAIVRRARRLHWPVGVHASGDGAVQVLLDVLEGANRELAVTESRDQVIHAHLVREADVACLCRLGAAVVVQPVAHVRAERDGLRTLFGEARAARLRPLRSMLQAGLTLAGSSDAPIYPGPPLLGIWAAVTRKDRETGRVLGGGEALDRWQALRLYTAAGAGVTGEAAEKGTLVPGKLADLVVLGGNPLTCCEDDLPELPVEMTVAGGRMVYSSGNLV